MKVRIYVLEEVKFEAERFLEKIRKAIDEDNDILKKPSHYPSKRFAEVKRSALDLKNELTKITQFKEFE